MDNREMHQKRQDNYTMKTTREQLENLLNQEEDYTESMQDMEKIIGSASRWMDICYNIRRKWKRKQGISRLERSLFSHIIEIIQKVIEDLQEENEQGGYKYRLGATNIIEYIIQDQKDRNEESLDEITKRLQRGVENASLREIIQRIQEYTINRIFTIDHKIYKDAQEKEHWTMTTVEKILCRIQKQQYNISDTDINILKLTDLNNGQNEMFYESSAVRTFYDMVEESQKTKMKKYKNIYFWNSGKPDLYEYRNLSNIIDQRQRDKIKELRERALKAEESKSYSLQANAIIKEKEREYFEDEQEHLKNLQKSIGCNNLCRAFNSGNIQDILKALPFNAIQEFVNSHNRERYRKVTNKALKKDKRKIDLTNILEESEEDERDEKIESMQEQILKEIHNLKDEITIRKEFVSQKDNHINEQKQQSLSIADRFKKTISQISSKLFNKQENRGEDIRIQISNKRRTSEEQVRKSSFQRSNKSEQGGRLITKQEEQENKDIDLSRKTSYGNQQIDETDLLQQIQMINNERNMSESSYMYEK